MKILVTSDTHGHYKDISDYIIINDDIELIIHAGDYALDAKNISLETGKNCIYVRGNNDFFDYSSKDLEIIKIKGRTIMLVHGHKQNVYRGYKNLLIEAKKYKANIVIFGHTHQYVNEKHDNILLINPGSPSFPRDNNPGFLVMDITENLKIKQIVL